MTRLKRSAALLAILFALAAAAVFPLVAGAPAPTFEALRAQIDAAYAAGDFEACIKSCDKAEPLAPHAAEHRWVQFRRADAGWRLERERGPEREWAGRTRVHLNVLEELAKTEREEQWVGRLRADAEESLGDATAAQGVGSISWRQAWEHYEEALAHWAGSTEIQAAKEQYLRILEKVVAPLLAERGSRVVDAAQQYSLLLHRIRGGARLAGESEQGRRLRYAEGLVAIRSGEEARAVRRAFEAAVANGVGEPWALDAALAYAGWLADRKPDAAGADCRRAEDLYRLSKGSRSADNWSRQMVEAGLERLVGPGLRLTVEKTFLPGARPEYGLSERAGQPVELSLRRIDLPSQADVPESARGALDFLSGLDPGHLPLVDHWTEPALSPDSCLPRQRRGAAPRSVLPGAYLLEARQGEATARELVLVSDIALVLRRSPHRALLFAARQKDGAPVAGAELVLHTLSAPVEWSWRGTTGPDGYAVVELPKGLEKAGLWAAVRSGDRQALVATALAEGQKERTYSFGPAPADPSVAVFTDRPVYRPGEKVHLKVVVRDGTRANLPPPEGTQVRFTLNDDQGSLVREGLLRLNTFGSASQEFDLDSSAGLGIYTINLEALGQEVEEEEIFRVEEYRLPEFLVSVEPVAAGGGRLSPGGELEAKIGAKYFSGGSLAGAEVEVKVYERDLWAEWSDPAEFPWFYEAKGGFPEEEDPGELLSSETLRLDATGGLLYRFKTSEEQDDARLTVRAFVTDAARRSERGSYEFILSEKPYTVHIAPGQNWARPGERVPVKVYLVDPGGRPSAGRGTLVITRETEVEIWQDPAGKSVQGEPLDLLRIENPSFPPPAGKGERPWKLIKKEVGSQEVLRRALVIGPDGIGAAEFTPSAPGYYLAAWLDAGLEKTAGVGATAIRVVGDSFSGLKTDVPTKLELSLDPRVVAPGGRARALLALPRRGAFVLFFSVADEIENVRLYSLKGTAALADVPVTASSAPALALVALTLDEKRGFQSDAATVTVPPLGRFLEVGVRHEKDPALPGSASSVQITVHDAEGRGVRAEVAVAVTDEAAFKLAGDPSFDLRPSLLRSSQYADYDGQETPGWRPFVAPAPPEEKTEPPPSDYYIYNGKTSLQGRITDEKGEPVIGATVQVTGPNLPGFQGAATDLNGDYRIPFLPAGKNYQVKVEAAGFATQVRQGIEIPVGVTINLPFKMSGSTSSVMVFGLAAPSGPRRSEVGAVISDEMINNIPLSGRSRNDIVYMAPMVANSGAENSVTVNGIEMTNSGAQGGARLTLTVRHDFRATAAWEPAVLTDEKGEATVKLTYPQNLTEWRATARAVTATGAGWAKASARTDQPLTARLEAPRFLVEGDRSTVSLVVTNRTAEIQRVRCSLTAKGAAAVGAESPASVELDAPPEKQVRAEWVVQANAPGEVTLEATATGATSGDAVRATRPVLEKGILQAVGKAGRTEGDRASLELELPEGVDLERSHLEVTATAGFSGAVLEALPYLAEYPYGCTEQTMSRFVPCVVAARALKDLNAAPTAVSEALSGRKGESLHRLDDMVDKGLQRLMSFRHGDGGWGWWTYDSSNDHMTAYVLWGLSLARSAGVKVNDEVFKDGLEYIERRLMGDLPTRERAWLLRGAASAFRAQQKPGPDEVAPEWLLKPLKTAAKEATTSTVFELALLVQAARDAGLDAEAGGFETALLAKAVDDRTGADPAKGEKRRWGRTKASTAGEPLAHWGSTSGGWWQWQDDPVSVTSLALLALAERKGASPEVRGAVNWLLARREGTRWSNTWNTAMAVMALCGAMRSESSPAAASQWEIEVNGKVEGRAEFAPGAAAVQKFAVGGKALRAGGNDLRFRRIGGTDRITYSASLQYIVTGDPIPPAGFGLNVRRAYDRIRVVPTLLDGLVEQYEPLKEGEALRTGDRVRCRILVEANENAEYVLLEDFKPAGLEAEEQLSGSTAVARALRAMPGPKQPVEPTGNHEGAYTEVRDDRVAFFFANLPAGVWELTYDLRAETPGSFTALPAQAHAMYAPHIRANSASASVKVTAGSP